MHRCKTLIASKQAWRLIMRVSSPQVAFLTACILQLPLSSVKISVLLFYKRIFTISEKLSVCIWIAIGVIVAWCIVFTGVSSPPLSNCTNRRLTIQS